MWYLIQMSFTYKNTTEPGTLACYRKGIKAVDQQIADNREWLAKKGHTEINCKIQAVGKTKPAN